MPAETTAPNSDDRQSWATYLARAGLVLDHCPDLLPLVACGEPTNRRRADLIGEPVPT